MGIPVATDNCGISSVINSFNNSNNASDTYLLGTTAVTWVVTDNTSNTGTCTFNVTVIDTEFPEITCISDTIINTDNGICGALFTYSITTLDNCSSTLSQTNGLTSGTIFPIGNTTNTYETVDLAGNTSTCTFNVMVIDNELPSIICPNNIVVCEENITITQPVVSDNCVITSLLNDFNNSSDASGLYPIGNTTINWIVTDSSGNTNSCLMNVQRDELPSVANAGEDQNVILNLPVTFDANVPTVGSGTWSLVSGDGSITNWSDPHAQVVDLMPGENIFTWTITNGVCPETYDEVIIHSLGLEIPTGFSPNGDNVNDKLEIIGIENLASELIIFNRWGVEVFSTSNYQNNWDGTSNKGMPLPEDTYFYILKLTELDVQENGYIVLKR
jgi:gliding motility-associated-like protein